MMIHTTSRGSRYCALRMYRDARARCSGMVLFRIVGKVKERGCCMMLHGDGSVVKPVEGREIRSWVLLLPV